MPGLAPSPPHVGSVLGERYELARHIARGGMGDVYEAEDQLLHRRVAVKVFRAAGPADRSRFDAEVRVLAGLNHPGLVRVFDAGSHGDDAYVVLELIDGPCLADVLADRGAVPADEVGRLGADLAEALDYIHGHGVVHRDVTPRNVLCGPDRRPRLVDFGIARLLESPRVTAASMAVGTAAFMAPEQVQGLDVTPAADVYSLGLLLLEALTGRRAFAGAAAHEVAISRLARDPELDGVPPAWQPLLQAMTARRPEDRPSAAAVREQLQRLAGAARDATAPLAAMGAAAAAAGAAAVPMAAAPPGEETTAALAVDGTAVLTAPPLPIDLHEEVARPPRRRVSTARWAILAGLALAAVVAIVALAAESPSTLPGEVTTIPSQDDADDDTTAVSEAPVTTVPETIAPTTTIPEVIPAEPDAGELPPGQQKKLEEQLERLDDLDD